eukprot:SAG11_NODE_974_length_6334_cov_29.611387_8_plen_126_part_00
MRAMPHYPAYAARPYVIPRCATQGNATFGDLAVDQDVVLRAASGRRADFHLDSTYDGAAEGLCVWSALGLFFGARPYGPQRMRTPIGNAGACPNFRGGDGGVDGAAERDLRRGGAGVCVCVTHYL